ncbi:hypothetical protein JCM8097_009173 [Rhodosporidiobolus ruineniae]
MSESASPPPVKPEPNTARRRPSHALDDNHHDASDEDSHQNKRVKTERSRDKGKGRAVHDDEDEDEDGHGAGDEDDEGEDAQMNGVEEDISHQKQQLIRDDSSYVTGSIIRIACHSFLTYDSVEFRPGPALNMIIGPNGTGKSTIACAIAIGLGFPAKVLGRSTKLSQYCKNDSNAETWIELELKGKPGKKNLTVRRFLYRDSEKSTFQLNGEEVPAHTVAEHMEELQVQVGNLCTFLPQDRVASFAMMSPPELLKETQKAAGHPKLSAWHDVLIKEGKELRDYQMEVDRYAEKLKRVQTKQTEAEKEVRAFEQRERLEQDLAVVDILCKYAQYQDLFDRHGREKTKRTQVQNEVQALEAKNKPFRDSKDRLRGLVKACEKEQDALGKQFQTALKDAQSKASAVEKLSKESTELQDQLQSIKKDEQLRKENIKDLQGKITKLQPLLDNEPAEADTTEIQRQINDKGQEKNSIRYKFDEVANERDRIGRANENLKRDGQHAQRQLEEAQLVSCVREAGCAKYDPGTWAATQWLRQHKDQFRGEIFEPGRFNVFPKKEFKGQRLALNQDMLNLIEGPIPMAGFSNFLFEYQEDYDKMFNLIVDEPTRQGKNAARFNGANIDISTKLSDVRRPLADEQLQQLGFDAFAIDLIDAPEPVLVWLCEAHGLHRMPVQLFRRELNLRGIEQANIGRYYTPDGSTSAKRALYGRRHVQLDQRSLERAKILASGVDQTKVDAAKSRLQQIQNERQKLKNDYDRCAATEQELKEQVEQIERERKELLAEKERMSKERMIWFKAKSKMEGYQKNLTTLLNRPSAGERREKLAQRLKNVAEKRVRYATEYKDCVFLAATRQEQSIKVHLQGLQADSDHRAMEAMVREKDQELLDKQQELEQVKAAVQALRAQALEVQRVAEQANQDATDEIRDRAQERRQEHGDASVDELERERDQLESNLSCMANVSPQVLEAYNRRKNEIAELEGKLESAEDRRNASDELINETKGRWLPSLQRLVNDVSAKFTASFDTLGLLGEVRLAQHEDYDKWGIEIMVSFRDRAEQTQDVTLHVLSGHRQSGGERALTTVTYLLALAELARAPFALVDEINQGMDQRAERNMHKMLVETTCKDDVGQYFLLTPKLLPDLVYHPKMKVLVINVSPWIPTNLKLSEIVSARRKLNKQRAAGGSVGRAIAA